MASVRNLKKKIHQQSFEVLQQALRNENQKINTELLMNLMDEALNFEFETQRRINACRNLSKHERKIEFKSIEEQVKDKAIYFQNAIFSILP